MSRLVTERDASERLGVSVRTLQKSRLRGNGPRFVKLGHAVRYDVKDLEAYIERARPVWFVLAHGRRHVMHFNVTANPTAQWVVQQLREAFPEASVPASLVHDRDSIFSKSVREAIRSLGTEPVRTACRSPWQNGTAESWVGTCRREFLDRVIVLNERHLHRRLREYVASYNAERVHTRLRDAPHRRPLETRPSLSAKVVGLPRVGGLHHRYVWHEAA